MPPSMTPSPGRQLQSAHHEVMSRVLHMALPWIVYLLFTFLANIVRLVAWRYEYLRVTAFLVLLLGAGVTALDYHLRTSRLRAVARWIGPATTAAGTLMLFTFLVAGYDRFLIDVWLFGGVAACLGWDLWMHASQHDLTRAFAAAAEGAGLGPARLIPARQRRAIPSGAGRLPRKQAGVVVHQGVTPAEVAAEATRIEGLTGMRPGSLSLRPSRSFSGASDYEITDPDLLDGAVLPWPGPSRPGGSVADPFRMGAWQDSMPLELLFVPSFNDMASGGTGSGKTMSYFWNRLAEGVTRAGYACFAADITKMHQFLGPVRDGLHGAATSEEEMLAMLEGLERARVARLAYLARRRMTVWTQDCGLTFLDTDFQECPDIFGVLEKLERLSRNKPGSPYTMKTWMTSAKAGRSSGMAVHASLQLGHNTEMPTVARGQLLGRVTFGLATRGEAAVALTARQIEANCRPELWGATIPGKAYVDLPTLDEALIALPARFYDWDPARTGRGDQIAAYMSEWRAEDRPLDEITGEAYYNVPAQPASYGLPGPGGRLPGRVPPAPAGATVLRPAFPQPPADPLTEKERKAAEAYDDARRVIAGMLAAGNETFTVADLKASGILDRHGLSRTWPNWIADQFEARQWVRRLPGKGHTSPGVWKILPAVAAGLDPEEEAE